MLALVKAQKVKKENVVKVVQEFTEHGNFFDNECIYCKYSQYALKESLRVGLQEEKQLKEQGLQCERVPVELPASL